MTAVIITVLLGVIGNIFAWCLIEHRQQIRSTSADIARRASMCLANFADSLDQILIGEIKKNQNPGAALKRKKAPDNNVLHAEHSFGRV